eukprot:354070-Chlamydomonas_euryale.AAC.3
MSKPHGRAQCIGGGTEVWWQSASMPSSTGPPVEACFPFDAVQRVLQRCRRAARRALRPRAAAAAPAEDHSRSQEDGCPTLRNGRD